MFMDENPWEVPADWSADVPGVDSTALPGGLLDVGREVFDLGKASLSKLLDVYAYREVAQTNAMYSPPPGYQRVPGTTQIIPAGKVGAAAAAGMSMTTVILLVAVVYLFAKKA